jgi:cytochrome P450
VIRYFFPFGSERISIAGDDSLKQVTVRNPYNYPKPRRIKVWMAQILGAGVLLAEGEDHAQQRKALAPAFSHANIRALAPIFWEKALLMSCCWRAKLARGTPSLEVLEWANRCTLDIIGKAGFGYEFDSLRTPDSPLRQAYQTCFSQDLGSRMLHLLQAFVPGARHIPAPTNRNLEASRRTIAEKATQIVRARELAVTIDPAARDIISLIIRSNHRLAEAGETNLSFDKMRDQIMTFLGAGHDTTATGVAWAIHLLSAHPDVQTRLRDEVRQCMPWLFRPADRLDVWRLEGVDIDALSYLHNVCRETLRYIPPIPMTVRECLHYDYISGYPIPPKTSVYMFANAINRLPEYWGPTADKFDPDRWDELPAGWCQSAYMSFLQGPRGCIGRKFAEAEMKIILCALMSAFEFRRDPETPDPEVGKMWRLVLRPANGIRVHVSLLEDTGGKRDVGGLFP